jgi:Tfp pilus assembly protein PilF
MEDRLMTRKNHRCRGNLLTCVGLALIMVLGGCNSGTPPKSQPEGKKLLSPQALEHFRQGHRFLADQKPDEALKEFQETVRLAPDSPLAYFWLGKSQFYRRDKEQAEKSFQKVLQLEPKNYHALTMLGEIYSFDKAKLEQAQKYLQQALDESPDNLEAHFHLGRVYALKGEREKALTEFRFVFAKEADFALYHFEMGRILEAWGQKEDALQNYRRALVLNPRFEVAGQAAKRLEEAPKGAAPAPTTTPAGTQPPAKPQGGKPAR